MRNFRLTKHPWYVVIAAAMLLLVGGASNPAYAAKAVKVVVGTSDLAPPGTDANFSLIAEVDKDGNVSGTWSDSFGKFGRIQAKVTCVWVVGNQAWIGGTVTNAADPNLIGVEARTRCVDGGAGGTGDFISFSFLYTNPAVNPAPPCSAQTPYVLVAFGGGNVSIK